MFTRTALTRIAPLALIAALAGVLAVGCGDAKDDGDKPSDDPQTQTDTTATEDGGGDTDTTSTEDGDAADTSGDDSATDDSGASADDSGKDA